MNFSRFRTHIVMTAFILALSVLAPLGSTSAQEQAGNAQPPMDVLPAIQAEESVNYDDSNHTHPPIKLTPDKSELVRLDQPAGSIIIGNPNHLSILADTSQTLVLVAKSPGATHFTVLDKRGAVIMQRHVIVASPKEKYLRIRRSCAGSGDDDCQATSVFYCPDMCHEIILGGANDASGGPADDVSAADSTPNTSDAVEGTPTDENLE